MALNTDAEHKSNLVVRIDQNSDSDLQALFDSVLKPDSKRPLQVPLRMRKLPDSFFTPPSTGSKSPSISHSRDNSSDSTPGLTVSHPRAHSSPASLQQTYASAQQQVQHLKQRSYDVGLSAVEDIGPLPPGWEQARTPEGQVYYLNHITRTTTWEDPRKTLAAQVAESQQQAAEQLIASGASSTASSSSSSQSAKSSEGTLGNLPDEWEQAATPEGEVYFINHHTRTTSWLDPRIPVHLQRSPAGALPPQHSSSSSWLHQFTPSQTLQACQQKLRLQSLQMERDRLKLRQQEIMRQVKCGVQQDQMLHGQPNSDLDPFMSEHPRQESADSGLGLGNGYSLPHTPEDFLSNMDDNMDGVSEGGNPSEMALDAPDMDNIDSTDLEPSLQVSSNKQLPWAKRWQELGEEFSSDILLEEVQSLINPASIKPDNVLTWL